MARKGTQANGTRHPAVEYFGSQGKLAEALGVQRTMLTHRKTRGAPLLTPQEAIRVEQLSRGRCARWQTRPDLWDRPEVATRQDKAELRKLVRMLQSFTQQLERAL